MLLLGFLPNMGPMEWVIILVALLLVFGASRIPQIARSLGKSSNEFKKGLRGIQNEIDEVADIKDDIKRDITKEEPRPQDGPAT